MSPEQAVLSGWLAGSLSRACREFLAITDVRQAVDGSGNYLPAFEVSLSTGAVLRVKVETVKEPTTLVQPGGAPNPLRED